MSEIQKLLKKLRKCTDWGMVEAVADALEAAAKRAEATEAKLARCVEALDAMVIVTDSGQPCYRTGNGIPQGIPRRIERVVCAALAAAKGGE